MQLCVVVNELHVAGLQLHPKMQLGVIGQRIEQVQRLDVRRCQAHGALEPLRAVDVLALVEHRQAALVPGQRRDRHPGQGALGHFAPAVGGDRVEQQGQQVGAQFPHAVVEGFGADQQRTAAGLGLAKAQQADHVGAVGVKGLALGGLVNAGVGVFGRGAEVTHMAEDVTGRVL